MTYPPLSIIILAAGKGTRMKSDKAKVLHELFYAPMVHHVIRAVEPLNADKVITVVGHQKDEVKRILEPFQVELAEQKEQLGTGHAVLAAGQNLTSFTGNVMILCGDTPLIKPMTLKDLYSNHVAADSKLTLLTTCLDNPTNYGRILYDDNGSLAGIVEEKDATEQQRKITEINAGIYCVEKTFLFSALKKVGTDNSQGEVYLTDILKIAVDGGQRVEKYTTAYPEDVLGVNSRVELAGAQVELQLRRNRELMLSGVTMYNPETIRISPNSSVGADSVIEPCVHIHDTSTIGRNCCIGQGAVLRNCKVADGTTIEPYTVVSDAIIG